MFKTVLVIFFLSVLSLSQSSSVLSVYDYHERVGIPTAKKVSILETYGITNRIVGGAPVAKASIVPYQAGLVVTLTTGASSICGGSLVSTSQVLTAAHCWDDGNSKARQFLVVLGSLTIFSGGTRISTSDIRVHPSWNPKAAVLINDIAILKFTPVKLNENIQPVSLPSAQDASKDFAGVTALATGFGKTRDGQAGFPTTTSLYQVDLKILNNGECQRSFEDPIHGSHLCTSGARGVGTCDGDSGGPLTAISNNIRVLVGITSFGLADGCQDGLPSVFTRVTAYLAWIKSNM